MAQGGKLVSISSICFFFSSGSGLKTENFLLVTIEGGDAMITTMLLEIHASSSFIHLRLALNITRRESHIARLVLQSFTEDINSVLTRSKANQTS